MPWSRRFVDGQGEYFRPLGLTEVNFYWDAEFNGTADCLQHAIVSSDRSDLLFTTVNVERAWCSLKACYPLLSASVEEGSRKEPGDILMVVREGEQAQLKPDEVRFESIGSEDAAQTWARELLNGPRPLSARNLSRLYVLARTDAPDVRHICIHLAHLIGDGTSLTTILRVFLDTLASPHVEYSPNLRERLDMALASDDPVCTMLPESPRQRFRRVIAKVIVANRTSKFQGGFTLPRKFSSATAFTPAKSFWKHASLPERTSSSVIENCRSRGITFGHALPVIGQIAMARVWYRHYLLGEIPEDEWRRGRKQPVHTGGPLNLRPFMDPKWFNYGGGGELCLSVSYFFHTLPFMPVGTSMSQSKAGGLPPCTVLLPPGRFFLRCWIIKSQIDQWMKAPLFLEISEAYAPLRTKKAKDAALHFRSGQQAPKPSRAEDFGMVLAFAESSLGNMEAFVRSTYPLEPADPLAAARRGAQHPAQVQLPYRQVSPTNAAPPEHRSTTPATLRVLSTASHLRARPAELYLSASTARRQLHFSIFFDGNVYTPSIVDEWMKEITDATESYLGSDGLDARL